MILGVLITMKRTDLAASTAFHTLVSEITCSKNLVELSRHDVWLAEFRNDGEKATGKMKAALEESLRFFNPNRQVFEIRNENEAFWDNGGKSRLNFFVWSKDCREGLLIKKNLEDIHGIEHLSRVVRGVIWRAGFSSYPSEIEVKPIMGFLANPSYQNLSILTDPVTPRALHGPAITCRPEKA
ncbi:MAG: hypothetical protein QME66_03170 [Candidatus Eisenbacteria bacterium]|nr:hypothetical protein [Candidatus Eisenbacteria bacterium]